MPKKSDTTNAPQEPRERELLFSEIKIEVEEGVQIQASLLLNDPAQNIRNLTMQIDVWNDVIPATRQDDLEQWLMQLLHRAFVLKGIGGGPAPGTTSRVVNLSEVTASRT